MTNQEVKRGNKTYHTCKPAMGFSFAAGTTDGPGAIQSIKQGEFARVLFVFYDCVGVRKVFRLKSQMIVL